MIERSILSFYSLLTGKVPITKIFPASKNKKNWKDIEKKNRKNKSQYRISVLMLCGRRRPISARGLKNAVGRFVFCLGLTEGGSRSKLGQTTPPLYDFESSYIQIKPICQT